MHRVLFGRVQALTSAGHGDDEVAEVVGAEAVRAFNLLEPSLGDSARA
ncbi:hypothetical protein ACQEVS_26120 [Streptomyces sp. CA-181903]